jgi:PST family polysaccharide transporter
LSTIKKPSTLKRLGENFLALSSLQLINYILPLFLIPLLIQALGMEGFGIYAFVFAIATYGMTFADYGFDLSATYHISLHKDKPNKVNEIFSSVLLIKSSLALFFLLILTLLVYNIEKLYLYKELIFLSYGIVLGNVLLPLWFFQGIEKMRFILYLNGLLKLLFFVLVVLLIKEREDLELLMALHSITAIIVGVLGLYIAKKHFNITLTLVSKKKIFFYLKDGWYIFTSKMAVEFYSTISTVIVGFYVSPLILGYYALSLKIMFAIGNLLDPITRVVYPYLLNIYQSSNQNFFKRNIQLSLLIFIIMVPISIIVYIFAREILEIISQKEISQLNVQLLQITALLLIVFPYASQFTNMLVSMKESKILNKILITAAVINVVFAPIILEFYGIIGMMYLHVFIAYYLIFTKSYFIYKKVNR